MEKIKLFYKNADGKDTHLIAEGEDIETAAKNAVKEFQILQEIFGEDKRLHPLQIIHIYSLENRSVNHIYIFPNRYEKFCMKRIFSNKNLVTVQK